MVLKELTSDQVNEIADNFWGEHVSPDSVIADALRAEVWARRITTRRALSNSVFQLLAPTFQIQLEMVKGVLENLEYAGDITAGDSGQIAAAPLRAIQIDTNRFMFVGGPDTKTLRTLMDCHIDSAVLPRRATSSKNSDILTQLSLVKSKVLSPQRWSGVDRAPVADSAWLSCLDEELAFSGKNSSLLETNCDEWRAYTSSKSDGESRWTKAKNDDKGRLWRSKHARGYWIFVWTNQQHPTQGMHISLSTNDAHRTRFAIDREADTSITIEYEKQKNEVSLQLPTLLPFQEYRYLITIGERQPISPYAISVPVSALDALVSLFQRLGITIRERS